MQVKTQKIQNMFVQTYIYMYYKPLCNVTKAFWAYKVCIYTYIYIRIYIRTDSTAAPTRRNAPFTVGHPVFVYIYIIITLLFDDNKEKMARKPGKI